MGQISICPCRDVDRDEKMELAMVGTLPMQRIDAWSTDVNGLAICPPMPQPCVASDCCPDDGIVADAVGAGLALFGDEAPKHEGGIFGRIEESARWASAEVGSSETSKEPRAIDVASATAPSRIHTEVADCGMNADSCARRGRGIRARPQRQASASQMASLMGADSVAQCSRASR